MDKDVEPLMAEFGAAIHDAQVLESSIELILSLLDKTAQPNEKAPSVDGLFSVYSNRCLGELIRLLKQRICVKDSEAELLKQALDTRNHLVHGFFKQEDRLKETLTPDGITTLINTIKNVRAVFRQAIVITDRFLNDLLQKYNLSVQSVKEHAWEMYKQANLEYLQRAPGGGLTMKNNDPYQLAWHELESGAFDKAIWARAFAEADGDENKAKAAYIRFRVAVLTNEAREKAQRKAVGEAHTSDTTAGGESGSSGHREEIPSGGFFTKLTNGDYGLPRTFWLFGVLVDVIVGIAARTIESTAAVVIFVLVYAAYRVLVLMGVWQAAGRYAEPKIWPVLAKIAVVLWALMLAVSLLLLQLINV